MRRCRIHRGSQNICRIGAMPLPTTCPVANGAADTSTVEHHEVASLGGTAESIVEGSEPRVGLFGRKEHAAVRHLEPSVRPQLSQLCPVSAGKGLNIIGATPFQLGDPLPGLCSGHVSPLLAVWTTFGVKSDSRRIYWQCWSEWTVWFLPGTEVSLRRSPGREYR